MVLLGLFLAVAGAAAIYVSQQAVSTARDQARQSSGHTARTAAGELDKFIVLARQTTAGLAANPQITAVLTHPAGCTLAFSGIDGQHSGHLDIIDRRGKVVCSSDPGQLKVSYRHSPWFSRALRSSTLTAPVRDDAHGVPVIVNTSPLPGGQGLIAAFDNLPGLASHLLSLYGDGKPSEMLLLSSQAEVITRSLKARRWIGTKLTGTAFGPGAPVRTERRGLDGVLRYYESATVPSTGWRLYVGEDKQAALAAERGLAHKELTLFLLALAVLMGGAWLLHRRLVAPIRRLGESVRGSSLLPSPELVPVAGPREVAELAGDINLMIESRKQIEEQLTQSTKMEAVGQLAGGVAHDFNNLLLAISGYTDLARQKCDDPAVRGNLDEALRAAERAGQLTHQLLAFSRRQIREVRPLDLNEIVRDTERMLARMISSDIRVVTSLAPQLASIEADAGQLSQMLVNLALNARDAMPEGGTMTFETTEVELSADMTPLGVEIDEGRYVRLSVSDTGVGISAADQKRLFEPFFTTKEVGKGTGLGLSTVYGIVAQSGGRINVYSELGAGTTFSVYLPLSDQPVQMPSVTRPATLLQGDESILLVEDEPLVREVVKEMLTRQGYSVTASGDPEEAITLEGDFDLLITDVVMPKLNGRQLSQWMRAGRPDLKVLYVSGYTSTAIVERGVLDDGVDFLQKPFAQGDLAAKVRELLDAEPAAKPEPRD